MDWIARLPINLRLAKGKERVKEKSTQKCHKKSFSQNNVFIECETQTLGWLLSRENQPAANPYTLRGILCTTLSLKLNVCK